MRGDGGLKRMVRGIKEGEALSVGSLSSPDMGFVMALEEWARPTDHIVDRGRKLKRGSEMFRTCMKVGQHSPPWNVLFSKKTFKHCFYQSYWLGFSLN